MKVVLALDTLYQKWGVSYKNGELATIQWGVSLPGLNKLGMVLVLVLVLEEEMGS